MKSFLFMLLLVLLTGRVAGMDEWPQYLGPNRDGTVTAPGLFKDKVSLQKLWVVPLGSGYSGVLVRAGKLYTMHTNGKMDALSCFVAATGKKLWSYDYGPTWPKVGSSEPGPLSTPVLVDNKVYGLGAQGELFCLDAGTGQVVWTRNIIKEFGAVAREVGIASSPLVTGNLLVLHVGDQKDKSVAAFYKETGKLAWHHGAEVISFQSPALLTLGFQQQLLAMSNDNMRGIEPASGKILWQHDSKEWIQAYSIGQDTFLVGHYHGFGLYRIQGMGMDPVTELWNNANLTLEYDMPVYFDGHLYGFKGSFLKCLDVATGQKVWTSRELGWGMASLIDGHLAIISQDGTFRIAPAMTAGYDERASIKIFDKSGLTAPSYADGVFYLRNYTHLAAVKVK